MEQSELTVRMAQAQDVPRILELLVQVNNLHHDLRPDLFVEGRTKYEADALHTMLGKPDAPILVAVDENGLVRGYLFGVVRAWSGPNLTGSKSFYIDDLCVDAACRGTGVGSLLLARAKICAIDLGCRDMTLNVWEGNDSAQRFYRGSGFTTRSCLMERKLR